MLLAAFAALWPAQASDEELSQACGTDPSWLCETVWNMTDSRFVARLIDDVVRPIVIAVLVLVIAALLNRWLRKLVTALITQFIRSDQPAGAALGRLGVGAHNQREEIRAATLSAVARTTVSAVIWASAVLIILGIFSINLAPLLASAGIAGLAVGLGAQQLVKDCIAGFFMLLEDQCGVGDDVDVGPATGTVEAITLRATTIRDSTGILWTVPNGTIQRIGNKSLGWSQGTVDVAIANASQFDDAVGVIERVAAEVSALPEVDPVLLEPIAVPGVESIGTDGPVVRVTVRTTPGKSPAVMRTLRAALTRALDAAGIGSDT
jgi:small conductance mechanosensitive channel